MQAFLALVPHLYQGDGKTVSLGESQVMYEKDLGYVLLRSELQTLQLSLNIYRCHSYIIQQAGGEIKREKLENK